MELKYIVLTIIKIVLSVPALLWLGSVNVSGAALMGGHIDNQSNSSLTPNLTSSYFDFDLENDQDLTSNATQEETKTLASDLTSTEDSEEIPYASPLVVSGYNLPENIFNRGKPFHLDKDPITGTVNFENKSLKYKFYDEYDYADGEPTSDIYDKANIDRKDGSLSRHKPSDANQLTPNLYDFLNLPVKYNPDKYVYPLISSSYANTKVQGNVNKHHNHKDYSATTYKPTKTPTYLSSTRSYFHKEYETTARPATSTRSTTSAATTRRATTQIYLTTKEVNLMNSGMNHPSFIDDYYHPTRKSDVDQIYLTTEAATSPSPTKKMVSLFDRLFGDYGETATTTERVKLHLFNNLPTSKKPDYDAGKDTYSLNGHAGPYEPNVVTDTKMEYPTETDYEYEDPVTDNIAVENSPSFTQVVKNTTETENELTPSTNTINTKYNSDQTYFAVDNETTTNDNVKNNFVSSNNYEEPNTDFKQNDLNTDSEEQNVTASIMNTLPPVTKEDDAKKPYQSEYEDYDYEYNDRQNQTYAQTTTTTTTPKVTSLPLGENHVTNNNRQPILVATQNLREQLNNEKVTPGPISLNKPLFQLVPSSNNIHIAPDQDTASFVVGNHQNVDGSYIGSTLKESPYDSNPFRPLYTQPQNLDAKDSVSYTIQATPEMYNPIQTYDIGASSINIQPIRNSEASLAIGVPVDVIKVKPGQVVDESLEINNEKIEFPKGSGPKIVFPDEKTTYEPDLMPPPVYNQPPNKIYEPQSSQQFNNQPNREVLKLNSKPMFHQLPSDLTPPSDKRGPQMHLNRERPPWDPRPGHFHAGRPEYARPPRPLGQNDAFKRIDSLPNILPQFRPNMKINTHYYEHPNKGYMRQPLLDRPSNRPIAFFEKLHPPPPPKILQHLRKVPQLEQELRKNVAEDRISSEGYKKAPPDQYMFYQTPPKIVLANRRNGDVDVEVETLQMLQAKQDKRDKTNIEVSSSFQTNLNGKDNVEKPLYVVYPVNTPPLKLDAIDTNKKESVVIGTRAELPLPPSKINQDLNYAPEGTPDFGYEKAQSYESQTQTPHDFYETTKLHEFNFKQKDRHDSPILKPHHRPNYPPKTDFPYPLERPDPSLLNQNQVATGTTSANDLDQNFSSSGNQWNSLDDTESRIVTGSKINTQSNQISAKLKTYTEKPIAVAYTPTVPNRDEYGDRYSLPNYGSPVIPEIRPGTVENASGNSEYTVSAVMHTHPQLETQSVALKKQQYQDKSAHESVDLETTHVPQLNFQAPFQASVNVDNISHGWSVIKDKSKATDDTETTTASVATTSEFDIENFKPQLIGGFKPLYNFPDDDDKKEMEVKEREEK